jgi:hypothetical protein
MAIQIEKNLLSRTNTMDPPSWIRLLEKFAQDPQKRREQVLNHQNEDVIKEQSPEQDDEVPAYAPPSDEAIQEPVSPAQQKEDEVSCFPFQDSNDTLSMIQKMKEKWKL